MLTHSQVWGAIDRLAYRQGLTASGLARKAGLDSTAFNPSKRIVANGHERWPSTESIAKVLAATGTSIEDFLGLLDGPGPAPSTPPRALEGFADDPRTGGLVHTIPQIRFNEACGDEHFDARGRPLGPDWDAIAFPDFGDPTAYALEVSGDHFRPVYRDGDLLVISPAADIRRGDRVVAMRRQGALIAGELARRTARTVELSAFNPAELPLKLRLADLVWMARIVWVSQ